MAEIKIERRKTGWIWVLLALVIAALLAYFLLSNKDNDTKKVAETEYVVDSEGEIEAYVVFVGNSNEEMTLDHAYTNEALLKLVDATEAKANEVGYEVGADLDKVTEYANTITDDAYETTHADYIRKSDDIIANILQNIQKENYPDLANEAKELRTASESINPEVLTLDQKAAVQNFFAVAADILKKMK